MTKNKLAQLGDPRVLGLTSNVCLDTCLICVGNFTQFFASGNTNALLGEHFDFQLFWDLHYRRFPDRGSGGGSRRENLAYKQALLWAEAVYSGIVRA